MRNKLLLVYLLFTVTLTFFAPMAVFSKDDGEGRLDSILSSVSSPKLKYPGDKEVYLAGKKSLKFQWALAKTTLVALDYIEFYLYKGEVLTEENLVFVKRLTNKTYSIEVDSSLFEDGQFYTWGIRQFFLRGEESNESFVLFMVSK